MCQLFRRRFSSGLLFFWWFSFVFYSWGSASKLDCHLESKLFGIIIPVNRPLDLYPQNNNPGIRIPVPKTSFFKKILFKQRNNKMSSGRATSFWGICLHWFCFHPFAMIQTCTYHSVIFVSDSCVVCKWIHHSYLHRETSFVYLVSSSVLRSECEKNLTSEMLTLKQE